MVYIIRFVKACSHKLGLLQNEIPMSVSVSFEFCGIPILPVKHSLRNADLEDLDSHRAIWDQKVYFWNILSGADIYWYNKINLLLLIALCLLLTLCCSLLFVYNSVLFIVECLKSVMYVRCEHQCVSDLGLL